MATPNEKAGITVTTTTAITEETVAKPSAISPAATIAPPTEIAPGRLSSVSTPVTAHNESLNPFDTDLEAMITTRTMTPGDDSCGMKSTSNSNLKGSPDGQVWPGQAHWKKKAKAARVKRNSCQMLAKMSKRNRIIAKVTIIALILAVAVAVGLGVSKATGARIWSPEDNN